MGVKIYLKTRNIEQIFQKFDIFPKNSDVLYTRVDFFSHFFFGKRLKVVTRTPVGGNLGRTSV